MIQPDAPKLVPEGAMRLPQYQPDVYRRVRRAFAGDGHQARPNENPFARRRARWRPRPGRWARPPLPDDAAWSCGELAGRLKVKPEQIVLGAGSSDVLELCVHLATPSDRIVPSAGSFRPTSSSAWRRRSRSPRRRSPTWPSTWTRLSRWPRPASCRSSSVPN